MMASGAASLGFAGVRVRTPSKVCTMCTPSCLPAPPAHFTQRRSSCRAGGDHQAGWAGAWGGEGSVPGVLGRRGEGVDLRWWRGWRCLGEREPPWRGLGMEDGYGRRGEREGEVDMGPRWRAWWRPGEREWWWRRLGVVDGYGRRGKRGARRGVWGEGEVDVGQGWRAWRRRGERERWWRGLGVGVLYGRWGEREVDMGRQWPSCWCLGERERRERAVLGGSRSAAVCGTGPHRPSRASQEAWAVPGGLRVVPPGTGGGGGPPSSMDPPRRGVVAAAAGGMGRVTVLGGVGPRGPFRVDVVAGGIRIRFLVRGGWLVRGGGRWR